MRALSTPFANAALRAPGASVPSHDGGGWRARLELGFEASDGRTVLRHRRHVGPLTVQRGFHPEGDPCHTYLLHPPGGVVGGDDLELEVSVAAGAHALVTTPAAGKFYRSAGAWATQQQRFRVAQGGVLEWLPALNIVHGGARVKLRSQFELDEGAQMLAWDHVGLGRPGSGDVFAEGVLDSRLEVVLQDRPLLSERLHLDAASALRRSAWGLQGCGYLATLLAWPADRRVRDALREAFSNVPGLRFACTLLPVGSHRDSADDRGLLVCRWLTETGDFLWEMMVRAWCLLRPRVLQREPCVPRIWST
jgi:urease accessory protein